MSRSFLDLINDCDCFPYGQIPETLYRLLLPHDPRPHGLMVPSIVEVMPWTSDFNIIPTSKPPIVQVLPDLPKSHPNPTQAINEAFAAVIEAAIASKLPQFQILCGRRSEPYLIPGSRYPGVQLDRFAHSLFGIVARGSHLTAYVRDPSDRSIQIWVQRRAPHLFTYPGKLDSSVAGGVKSYQTPTQCIVEESFEEASMDNATLTEKLRAVGTISYVTMNRASRDDAEPILLSPEVLYLYDLELPADFVCKPEDGEAQEFLLWGVDRVVESVWSKDRKTNSALVIIDFLIRHGSITTENEPNYEEIISRTHRRLPVAVGPDQNEPF